MKIVLIIWLTAVYTNTFSQAKTKVSKTTHRSAIPEAAGTTNAGKSEAAESSQNASPRQTATERYLNGLVRNGGDTTSAKGAAATSPFAGGVHAAENATKTFDTVPNANNANSQRASTTVAGGNDTTFNVNTMVSQGGVTTNSGAVDRSGQAQFGQTNWGNSRSTVGESQWTIPPPITASFNRDFPASNAATWTRNNVDTTIYSARYKTGARWVITSYNSSGQRLDMRTEFPLMQPPRPVSVYMAKQPQAFKAATIYRLQIQGKPDMYEIETANGKRIYINNDGMEVTY
ncbi:hypothetical protein [Segetibacter sp.]|jgi:hypothetical protein|uniref:hypothetical protein n=1 Tax=Segetibacter sp. TaxID=2231182 RepID=UPI00260E2E37|nr:hypothetical protein [Segetibacter sp.]MCW3082491.1 hypothetical protein [Segetibacter sp.]